MRKNRWVFGNNRHIRRRRGFYSGGMVSPVMARGTEPEAAQLPATEKRDLLARLLRRLAHEIRNPLSSLDVHFQLLEEDLAALAPRGKAQLGPRLAIIHGELHRLDSIVERFLKLAGPSELELAPVAVGQVVTHVCDLLRPEAATRQVEILAEMETDLPVIAADSVRLTQVLLNLVINGLQAMPGAGVVRVKAAQSGEALLLSVADTGPGVPTEHLGAIFDPYFTTKPEGCGLGLWIAQQIAVAHGGDLRAANAAGGGAVFTLSLPLVRKEPG